MNDTNRLNWAGRVGLACGGMLLLLGVSSGPAFGYAPVDGEDLSCGHPYMDAIKEHLRQLSGPGALDPEGEPGLCGCDSIGAFGYPNYKIRVTEVDPVTEERDTKELLIEGETLETAHFAVHYPATAQGSSGDGSSALVTTNCMWDWDLNEVKDFGTSGYYVDCSQEALAARDAAAVLENAWEGIMGMGYPEPPRPHGLIDIYVGDLVVLLGGAYEGVAEPCADSAAGGPSDSRMFVNSEIDDIGVMEEVMVHEFFHVVQSGIDHKESLAWMESTALWMQDLLTGGGTWGYAAWGIISSDQPLTDLNPWQLRYGNVVWPMFLEERYGPEIMLDIWLEAGNPYGDDGMLHAYDRLQKGIDGYAAGIHLFRYDLWESKGAPVTEQHGLSRRNSQVQGHGTLEDTTASFILLEGDPGEPDGKLKLCFENPSGSPGLWARVALPQSGDVSPDRDQDAPYQEYTLLGDPSYSNPLLFHVRRGPDGVTFADVGREELTPWGPAAFTISEDGHFWIADTAAGRVLELDPVGDLVTIIDLQRFGVTRVSDVAAYDQEIMVLESGSRPARVLRLTRTGDLLAVYELPARLALESGLSGISVGDGDELIVELEGGTRLFALLNASGQVSPTRRDAYREGGLSFRLKLGDAMPRRRGSFFIDNQRVDIVVRNILGGVTLVGVTTDGRTVAAVDEVKVDGVIRVDKTVRAYNPDGSVWGVARFPLDQQFTYVEHPLAVGPDGEVYAMLTRPDRIEVRRLEFAASLGSIFGNTGEDGELPTMSKGAPDASTASCLTRAEILDVARSYIDYSQYLSDTNVNGSCSGRGKPVYLGGAGDYSSLPYDWGGFDSLSDFAQYMGKGYQAGDVDSAAVESCSRGVDCSGFLSRTWKTSTKYGTSTLSGISYELGSVSELKGGDAFNKPSTHVMLFDTFSGSGAYVYESTTGGHDRVVYQYRGTDVTNSYTPIRYYDLCDPDEDPGGDPPDGDDDSSGDDDVGDDDGAVGDDDSGGDPPPASGDDDGGETGGADDGSGAGGTDEVYEVSLDYEDTDCAGGYLEIDGFGTSVPWVALVVTFAGDPATGDLCSGHGAYELCGHKGSNPPCGSADFQYSATVEYPSEPINCSLGSGSGQHSPHPVAWLLLGLPPLCCTIRRRFRLC